ncbi:hypothetical protein [Nocardia huaxiensis]|uniref:Uncharacterized protein n=1 Tax=Nocardia huaxiensis TaxID=2755382 RepID=A0A7D6V9D3_9NOCA|nr:hypothetical protein [Nocardia huaxiensis]QLY29471.1 hypothetical protein H0264_30075 [Nocardia huaxiensis]UFS96977.1 hypothetical protein LPY97_03315 [Nocardia huaxiensis]
MSEPHYFGTGELSEFLRMPPWERAVPRTVVLPGLRPPAPPALHWTDGEQARWERAWMHDDEEPGDGWQAEIDRVFAAREAHGEQVPWLLAAAPFELVEPYGHVLNSIDFGGRGLSTLRRVLARFGDKAVTVMVRAAQRDPDNASVLLPVDGTAATFVMARLLRGYRTQRDGLAWFARHIGTAAPDLVAAAVDAPQRQRTLAWTTLDTLSRVGHREAIHCTAAEFGADVLAAVETRLRPRQSA